MFHNKLACPHQVHWIGRFVGGYSEKLSGSNRMSGLDGRLHVVNVCVQHPEQGVRVLLATHMFHRT